MMYSMPRFSVIVPTYNSSATLGRLIDSVLSQTFKEFEVLLIDGGSSDGTINIIKAYSEADQRIRWISEMDNGIYDAMNKGIKLSKGAWLYFIGSDDFFSDPYVLSVIDSKIRSLNGHADILYGDVYFPTSHKIFDGPFDPVKICRYNLSHQAMFIKRNVFSEMGLYNLKYKIFSDWDFNLRCFFNKGLLKSYTGVCIAHYSTTGISSQIDDKDFRKDWFPLIRKIGYRQLPLKVLKSYCRSNFEFLSLLLKRIFIPLTIDVLRTNNYDESLLSIQK